VSHEHRRLVISLVVSLRQCGHRRGSTRIGPLRLCPTRTLGHLTNLTRLLNPRARARSRESLRAIAISADRAPESGHEGRPIGPVHEPGPSRRWGSTPPAVLLDLELLLAWRQGQHSLDQLSESLNGRLQDLRWRHLAPGNDGLDRPRPEAPGDRDAGPHLGLPP
jgi:hypothetical protein